MGAESIWPGVDPYRIILRDYEIVAARVSSRLPSGIQFRPVLPDWTGGGVAPALRPTGSRAPGANFRAASARCGVYAPRARLDPAADCYRASRTRHYRCCSVAERLTRWRGYAKRFDPECFDFAWRPRWRWRGGDAPAVGDS